MKRLLEWKQRMLQSPLSRKYSGSSNRGSAQNDLFKNYKPSSTPSSERPTEPDTSRITEEWSTTGTSGDISRPEPWEVLAGDETDIAGDTRKLKIKNASDQQNRRYRDRSQDGRSSANSLSKYSSASSDEEGRFLMQLYYFDEINASLRGERCSNTLYASLIYFIADLELFFLRFSSIFFKSSDPSSKVKCQSEYFICKYFSKK